MARTGVLFAVIALFEAACVPRPRMCAGVVECGARASCVAGRCQPEIGVPAILGARRIVVAPVDVAYLSAHAAPLSTWATLGRDGDARARILLRFSVVLPRNVEILEAYLLLDRAEIFDEDPAPIRLFAARVTERWDARSSRWATPPRIEEGRPPITRVILSGPMTVRLDVHELVRRWPLHDPRDQGIAVMADRTNRTGISFALLPIDGAADADVVAREGHTERSLVATPSIESDDALAGLASAAQAQSTLAPLARAAFGPRAPRLELYVK